MKKVGLVVLAMLNFVQIGFAAQDYSKMSNDEFKKTLMASIAQNNEEVVFEILAHPKVTDFDKLDLTRALELAAEHNYLNIAHALIKAGADIKERYCFALKQAAQKGYTEMVKLLLTVQGCDKRDYSKSYYMDINYFNSYRDDALIQAAKNGHLDVMQELINAGANVNFENNFGQIALLEAVRNGHVAAVRKLLQAKAKVNAANQYGETALSVAIRLDHADLIKELTGYGASVYSK